MLYIIGSHTSDVVKLAPGVVLHGVVLGGRFSVGLGVQRVRLALERRVRTANDPVAWFRPMVIGLGRGGGGG